MDILFKSLSHELVNSKINNLVSIHISPKVIVLALGL